jgi:hypothetical protein
MGNGLDQKDKHEPHEFTHITNRYKKRLFVPAVGRSGIFDAASTWVATFVSFVMIPPLGQSCLGLKPRLRTDRRANRQAGCLLGKITEDTIFTVCSDCIVHRGRYNVGLSLATKVMERQVV